MICPNCGNPVDHRAESCPECGFSLLVYGRIIRLSNIYYNRGLERAKVRDLSGAVTELRHALSIWKGHIEARNLLGLVLFEMGEVVSALREWVISKNLCPDDNEADYYMEQVGENPTKLDEINRAIVKYNAAIELVKQGSEDLAIIQLKKVINTEPGFLRAEQFLALLYIKTGEYEKARKVLMHAIRVDVANTTTLRYLDEIRTMTAGESPEQGRFVPEKKKTQAADHEDALKEVSHYREDKPSAMLYINLVLGILIGVLVVYYLIVPTIRSNIKEEYKNARVDYSSELAAKSATITQLEKNLDLANKQITEQSRIIETYETTEPVIEYVEGSYSVLFELMEKRDEVFDGSGYTDEEIVDYAIELYELDTSELNITYANKVLSDMKDQAYPLAARLTYRRGKDAFDAGEYEDAVRYLKAAVAFDPTSDGNMYYLGKALQASEEYEEAAYYYRLMLEVCPNSTLKQYISTRLNEMGME